MMTDNQTFLNTAPAFHDWGRKAEEVLVQQFPTMIDSGNYKGIHIGRNTDAGIAARGGYRVRGTHQTMAEALYFETPEKMIHDELLVDENLKRRSVVQRATDSILRYAAEQRAEYIKSGLEPKEAEKRVTDTIQHYGYFDQKTGQFVVDRIAKRVNDSILAGMTTPHWDIALIQRIFRQPFLQGYAEGMVNKIGLPNVWADLVQIFTETFEGYARVSNVAKTMTTFNTSIAAKNRTGTMLSELINIVIDYESPQIQEMAIGAMPGNWLTNATIGSRDAYANLMLEQLLNVLIYFGHAETGFEGLTQIAMRDGTVEQYQFQPAAELWQEEFDGTNSTVGADLLVKLSHFIANKMEELNFLPVECKIRCSPILYKVFKYSQLSRVFNQNNPLSVINTIYESGNKLVGTMATKSGDGLYKSFEIVPDPMLMPDTPFNPNPWDIMFMTFPTIQSALDGGMSEMILCPVPIDKMILPSAPGFRDGVVRTALKRVGSLLVPVEKVVHVIEGMGTNNWWVP